jgi:hypothetical protein
MCIEVAEAEDDSLVESATSQKLLKRSISVKLPPALPGPCILLSEPIKYRVSRL